LRQLLRRGGARPLPPARRSQLPLAGPGHHHWPQGHQPSPARAAPEARRRPGPQRGGTRRGRARGGCESLRADRGPRADPRVRRHGGRGVPPAFRDPRRRDASPDRPGADGRRHQRRDRRATGLLPADRDEQAHLDPEEVGGCVMSGTDPGDDPSLPLPQFERVVATCDRFEAAWRAGQRPRVEDFLGEVPETERPELLCELLLLELELRRARGERPTADEYRARFPSDGALIDDVFREAPEPHRDAHPRPRRRAPAPDPAREAGRNLLFGVLALQNDFISRDDLLAAFAVWVADKARPLGQILVDRGALDDARRALLEALVGEHLKRHGDDPVASLAAVSSLGSVREDLEELADPDLQASLSTASSRAAGAGGEAAATATFTSSSSRSAAARFRVLRFHKQGGLGQIYVARDEELGRDVALKEIPPDKIAEADLRSRFVLEAEITGGLEHPGIVPVYSLGTYDDGRPFYAMRFVEGDSLMEAVAAYHRGHPRPDPT